MNQKGFTLVELLVGLLIIGLLSLMVVYTISGTFSTSMTQIDEISDNQIFEAAKDYVLENNMFQNSNSVCILVEELVDAGYIDNDVSQEVKTRIVKINRNSKTKNIEEIKYVLICN